MGVLDFLVNKDFSNASNDSTFAIRAKEQQSRFKKLMDQIRKNGVRDVAWVDHADPCLANARIYLTELCNSHCLTCNFWKSKNEVQLDTITWKDILQQIRSIGITSLEFVGGEPTMRADLLDIIKEARELRFASILISSNGFLLNDGYISKLIDCGANGFHISLDGLRDTYRYVRGVDWFEKVLLAISSIAKTKAHVLVLTNLTRQVIDDLEALADIVQGMGAFWAVNIIENLKYGFAGVDLATLSISSSDDIEKVISILLRIKRRHSTACLLRDSDILYIKDYLYDPQRERSVPCTLGFKDIYLDPRGNVFTACMSMNPIGNVLTTKLRDIVQSGHMKSNLKAMLLRQCRGCTCGYPQRAELMKKNQL
jgi:MoaA/NifB/PqqE/SkfB family radical SAM enzyme